MGDIRNKENGVVLTEEQKKILKYASQDFAQNRVDRYANVVDQLTGLNTEEISGGELSQEEQKQREMIGEKSTELLEDVTKEAIDLIKEALKNKGYSQKSIEQICSNEPTNNSEILAQRREFEATVKKVVDALLKKRDREVRNRLIKTEDGKEQAITEQAMLRCGITIKPFPLKSNPQAQQKVDAWINDSEK